MKISQCAVLFLLFSPFVSFAQEKFDFYLSNKGNDAYPGTSNLLPKKSIAGVAPLLKTYGAAGKPVKVGLNPGDVWEENLVTSYPIQLNTYSGNSLRQDLAILDGSQEFSTGWVKDSGTINTFYQKIPYHGFLGYGINGIGSYSYIYVFEIDKLLERTAPFTARRMLRFVESAAAVENTAGSFYTPPGNSNPMPLFIHTSDGNSPNGNTKYRYEVCVKDWAVNSTYQENNRFENLWVRGFGAGNGILPGGANSYYNKVIFGPGAASHHLVVRSGTIDHSLFLPGPKNTSSYAVVFYDTAGMGRHCTIKNSIFLDIRSPVYAHISEGTNYGAVELNNVVSFADSTESEGFVSTVNTDTVILNNVYVDKHLSGYYFGSAKYATINNCWFKDVTFGIGYSAANPVKAFVSNIFIKTKSAAAVYGAILQQNTSLELTNSIFHLLSTNTTGFGGSAGAFLSGTGGTAKITSTGNIFICEIAPSKSVFVAGTNMSRANIASHDKWDNNVYVLLRGKRLLWTATDTSGSSITIQNFEEWKKVSGQDQHSLFFDLRYDVRGLKAIFADPENGNYDLANTPEGKQIAALHAGMTDPLTCFLSKPTYEQAANLVSSNTLLTVNSCRNPCVQNTIRVNTTFAITAINNTQAKLQWNIPEQQNIDHYELQRAEAFFGFRTIASKAVSTDSSYAFTDNVQTGIAYRYRLVITAKSGNRCYSDNHTFKIESNQPFNIYPNPSSGKISISLNGYIGGTDFSVVNAFGQTIRVVRNLSVYRTMELNLSEQPKGIYFLKMKTKNGISVQKFILQ